MSGTLFIVATPLGNLQDMSPRGVQTLRETDRIACEDTRRTGRLLAHFGVQTPSVSFHEHNEQSRAPQLLRWLEEGSSIALVCDAGTPLISDPGYRLVADCRRLAIPVVPIPGPCAAVAALSVSGLSTDRFFFAGFPAKRTSALKKQIESLADLDCTLIFYLSPHRLAESLKHLLEGLGDRRACLMREMTKLHETALWGALEEILEAVGAEPGRGEYTLVVEGRVQPSEASVSIDVAAYVAGLERARGLARTEAVKLAARQLGLPRREVYKKTLGQS